MITFEENESRAGFYRALLKRSKTFLTEISDDHSINSDDKSQSIDENHHSSLSSFSLVSKLKTDSIDEQLISTRSECHQRLLACSRKKLRLLTLQQQNENRHLGFKRFIDNLDEKRCANIRRYQMELKEYLLKRLETDRLKEEVLSLNQKIDYFKEEKRKYTSILDLVQRAIPLFPNGLLQNGSDGVRSLILRYQTLVETKISFEQRDFSKEKQERRRKLQRLLLEHNTKLAQLNTRLSELNHRLIDLQKTESIKEQQLINQIDFQRLTNQTLSQLLASINYLYDRYRLTYQLKKSISDPTPAQKLRVIQEFIIYRVDLVQRVKS